MIRGLSGANKHLSDMYDDDEYVQRLQQDDGTVSALLLDDGVLGGGYSSRNVVSTYTADCYVSLMYHSIRPLFDRLFICVTGFFADQTAVSIVRRRRGSGVHDVLATLARHRRWCGLFGRRVAGDRDRIVGRDFRSQRASTWHDRCDELRRGRTEEVSVGGTSRPLNVPYTHGSCCKRVLFVPSPV